MRLQPLHEAMKEPFLTRPVLHPDETPVPTPGVPVELQHGEQFYLLVSNIVE